MKAREYVIPPLYLFLKHLLRDVIIEMGSHVNPPSSALLSFVIRDMVMNGFAMVPTPVEGHPQIDQVSILNKLDIV